MAAVSFFQPAQSSSPMPSSRLTMGYLSTQSAQNSTISLVLSERPSLASL